MATKDKKSSPSSISTNRDKEFLNKAPAGTTADSESEPDRALSHNVETEKIPGSPQDNGRIGRAREVDDVNNDRIHDSRQTNASPDTSAQINRPPSSDRNANSETRRNS